MTLECWIAGRSRLVATSSLRRLPAALAEVRDDLRRQLDDAKTRTEPRNNRHLRPRDVPPGTPQPTPTEVAMTNIQQPEMRRSGKDPLVQDSAENKAGSTLGGGGGDAGPVPPDQQSPYGPQPPRERRSDDAPDSGEPEES